MNIGHAGSSRRRPGSAARDLRPEPPAAGTRCSCGGRQFCRWREGVPDSEWRCWACSGGPGCGYDTRHVDLVSTLPRT
jgi:hypothetical protein